MFRPWETVDDVVKRMRDESIDESCLPLKKRKRTVEEREATAASKATSMLWESLELLPDRSEYD
ncbi:hypothetical protein KHV-MN_00180 [Cyprinid herpesvirus 3]|nr:hypothetical protein KHV-MN_00014 [Cyprinid herpesvirus 3]QQZ02259.1 hypothetical protein KHV-MN_00180 [Cyprinid herpesvirus 3]